MINYFNLSVSDLMLLEGFKEAYNSDNKILINKYLFNNGLDVNQTIEEVSCLHRNLQNKVVDCLRFEGVSRTDPAWLATGAASLNDHINSTDDRSFQREMRQMSREGYSWEEICERLPEKQEEGIE